MFAYLISAGVPSVILWLAGLAVLAVIVINGYRFYRASFLDQESYYHSPNSIVATWTDDDLTSSHPLAMGHSELEMGENPFGS